MSKSLRSPVAPALLRTALLLGGFVAAPALPVAAAEPASSNMAPASGNTAGANHGVGTAGSLQGQNGSASSTVAGVHGSQTGIATPNANKGVGAMESDPALGGGKQTK